VIKPLSLTGEYHLAWSGDPAFDAPPAPEGDAEASPERKEWVERFKLAQRSGTKEAWQALLKPGQVPTLFRFRQIPTSLAGKMISIARSGDIDPVFELHPLVFRVALRGVENWAPGAELKVKHATDATFGKLGQIATEDAVNAVSLVVAIELGSYIWQRVQAPDPLS
jgi:hypothetical protein